MATPYNPPEGDKVGLNFGAPYIAPDGDRVALEFLEETPVSSDQYVFPVAIGPSDDSNPGIRLQQRKLNPIGFDAMAGGNPASSNRNHCVVAGNIVPPAVGTSSTVWLYTHYLLPSGLLSTGFSSTNRVSHDRQYVQLTAGIPTPDLGTTWVSPGTRLMAPTGSFLDAVGRPNVGGTRYLMPFGWDPLAFGDRIIPEILSVAPQGFRELWGEQEVKNRRSYVSPAGFESTGQEEYRWGRLDIWNLVQYIQLSDSTDSQLHPPEIIGWTSIGNRNRVIKAYGATPVQLGFPQIENGARLILPGSIAPPESVGNSGMIAYRIRSLPLDGVDAPIILRWAAVYNAAKVIAPSGIPIGEFGQASFGNTRRYFSYIGAIDSASLGEAFVAFRVRSIAIEPRYNISPPPINLPEAKLFSRYINGIGSDALGMGLAALSIHFNKIGPKWVLKDAFGEPRLHNVTPEVTTYGADAEAFGNASVILQWRPIAPDGSNMQLFGFGKIADRKQKIAVPGVNLLGMGPRLAVTKTGAPPYSPQTIIVDSPIDSESQVGKPGLNQYVLYVQGILQPSIGEVTVSLMGANIDAGIKVDGYGVPSVVLKNNQISVGQWPDSEVFDPSVPRLSPHTILAVKEAPAQAQRNNPPSGPLHYVGETNIYPPGTRFGSLVIGLNRWGISAQGIGQYACGQPSIDLKRHYLSPIGLQAYRMGWVDIGDGTQFITEFGSTDSMGIGAAGIGRGALTGTQRLFLSGIASAEFGQGDITLFKRAVSPGSFNALSMGNSRGEAPYQWQSLHVGPPMPSIPQGFDASSFGEGWISLRVRGITAQGLDAFLCEYDLSKFSERLRIGLRSPKPLPPIQTSSPVGIEVPGAGVLNIRPGIQYIRPDGNSDQFRKGAF